MAVGLSESATIGVLLLLIFGAISFYLYSRINYTEKRMSLMENMLLDIKVGLQMTTKEEAEFIPEPVGAPTPMETEEAEVLPEEETYYQSVLQQAQAHAPEAEVAPEPAVQQQASVTLNYESMTKDELIALAEKRGVKMGKRPGRKDLIAALRKPEDVPGASPTSEIFPLAAQLEQVGDEAETLE
jgi:hypothetical protein